FFSSRRRHTRSVSAFLLNRSSDLPHKVHRMEMKTAISCTILRHTKILIAVGVCIISLATLGSKNHTTNITKIVTQSIGIIIKRLDRKSGSAGMPRPISYAVFCLKKKNRPDPLPDSLRGFSPAHEGVG